MYYAVHLDSGQDTNGNPKRCFVIYNAAGDYVDAVDEGYEGTRALRRARVPENSTVKILGRFKVTRSEYNEAVKGY